MTRFFLIFGFLLVGLSQPAVAQTKELRADFISKFGGSTYRLPTFFSSIDSKFADYVYIRADGTVFGIKMRGLDQSTKTPLFRKSRRSRVSVKPFNSQKKVGVCLGASQCHDINSFSAYRSWKGDAFQLQSGNLKKSLSLLGL